MRLVPRLLSIRAWPTQSCPGRECTASTEGEVHKTARVEGLKMSTVGERIQQLNDLSTLRKKTRTQTQASSDKRTTGRRCSSRLRPNGLDIAVARFQVYWNMVRILYSLIPVRP